MEQAHYLFTISTIKTIEGSHELGYALSEGIAADVQKAEEASRKRVCVGNQVSTQTLVSDLESRFSSTIVSHAMVNMIKNAELKEIKGRKYLVR